METLIKTDYNEILAASLYEKKQEKETKGVLIIAPAMGVQRTYYKHIAVYFSETGYNVLTFDYLGIGDSVKVNDPKNCNLRNWGFRDLTAVIDYCEQKFIDELIYLLGHSIAGQVFPFAKNKNKIKSACFVASQNVSNTNWSGKHRLIVDFFWYFHLPFFNTLFNGLPGFAFGGNQKIPKRVASEWRTWGLNKLGASGGVPDGEKYYQNTSVPVKFLSFEDDHMFAPKKAAIKLFESYGSKIKQHKHFIPKDLGLKQIGHFGFFRKSTESFWSEIDRWFSETSVYKTNYAK